MSITFQWCKDKTKLAILNKPVFCVNRFGNKFWYLNGELHREDGPAIEYDDGYKIWYLNGKYHRVDAPAGEYANGGKSWYLNGRCYTESDYWKELNK